MILTHLFNIEVGDDKEVVILEEDMNEYTSTYTIKRVKGFVPVNDGDIEEILINTTILSEDEEGVETREVNGLEMTINYKLNAN